MPKIALCAVLFILVGAQTSEGQPRRAQPQSQREQAQSQPSPTPTAETQNNVSQAAEVERERDRKERDATEDAFRAEQQRQNRIISISTLVIAIITGLNLIVAGVYAFFAYRTLKAVDKQAGHAGEQVEKMQAQLEAINKQEGHLRTQSEAAQDQTRAMLQQLAASEQSVGVAADALKLGSQAYIGIRRATVGLPESDVLSIELENIGKAPATQIKASLQVVVSVPLENLQIQPNVRQFSVADETYDFGTTGVYAGTLTPILDYALSKEFSPEELLLVIHKNAFLSVSLTLEYWNGYEEAFAYFHLTYKGDKTNWGVRAPTN